MDVDTVPDDVPRRLRLCRMEFPSLSKHCLEFGRNRGTGKRTRIKRSDEIILEPFRVVGQPHQAARMAKLADAPDLGLIF